MTVFDPGLPFGAGLPGVADFRLFDAPGAADPGAPSLGSSLKVEAGDLVIDELTGGPAQVRGRDALVQALVLAVETQSGSDRLNTEFGFDRLAVGRYALGVPARKEYLRMQLVRSLSADRRVRDVREVFFEDDPRFSELRPGLDEAARQRIAEAARSRRGYTAYAVIETVAGSTLTFESGGRLD
ncbi:hypothetical protein [Streptomyces sp. A012304]|uniref:hypothetical protein n=1 Tax=Streptomyces sp. A012304 TaxID=375446 RepID=UPI00223260D0|nr:hypothetical protein [Streptomyces sp. A012304]GKQ37935.1 hypothetical protein ALMP_44700 [Streptomyces sp. A012304]